MASKDPHPGQNFQCLFEAETAQTIVERMFFIFVSSVSKILLGLK